MSDQSDKVVHVAEFDLVACEEHLTKRAQEICDILNKHWDTFGAGILCDMFDFTRHIGIRDDQVNSRLIVDPKRITALIKQYARAYYSDIVIGSLQPMLEKIEDHMRKFDGLSEYESQNNESEIRHIEFMFRNQ